MAGEIDLGKPREGPPGRMEPRMTTTEPEGLRKYRLIAEIGKGGMAEVFLAVVQGPAGFNKLIVIKKTRAELSSDPEFVAMFLDEARLAARLNHPNVVQTHEVGEDGGRYFIAMEYLDGQPLNKVRSRAGASFSPSMQARVLADVLAGLHHAHELCDFDGTQLGVVHRDATPQNVFVTYDGLVKVVDFGIAKAIDSSSETRTGVVKGKVSYMAPEQAHGDKVDRRTDVFAVGVMLWEALVGHRMWKGVADIAVLTNLVQGKIPDVAALAPDAPPGLVEICRRALSPSPKDRFESAVAMQEALEAWLSATPDRPSARDVGRFVAGQFADDRARIKAMIESQLRDVRWSGSYPRMTGVDLPRIDPAQVLVTPTGNLTGGGRAGDAALHTPVRVSSLGASAITRPGEGAPAAPRPNKQLMLVAVGGLAAVGVLVLGVRLFAPTPATSPAATLAPDAASPREPTTAAAAAPASEVVKLTVKVTPANARIMLDDALLSVGPFEGKLVRGDKPRKLRAEATGYLTKEEVVTLTGDMMLSLALEREAGAPSASPAPAPQGPGPRPRAPIEPPRAPDSPPAPLPPPVREERRPVRRG